MKNVGVLNYGVGNILSVSRALEKAGAKVLLENTSEKIKLLDRLVIPGVGAFSNVMQKIEQNELIGAIKDFAASGKPVLGICVGMQILLSRSFEFGCHEGLDLISGEVKNIKEKSGFDQNKKIPHIGWSRLSTSKNHSLFKDCSDSFVYFVHSYSAQVDDPNSGIADVEYAKIKITAAVESNNILGVQFHPEKSGPTGLKILENFLEI